MKLIVITGGPGAGKTALIELARDPLKPGDRAFDLVGYVGHLLSIGVSGEGVPSSFAWFTPSARAI